MELTQAAFRLTLSAEPCGQGMEPFERSWKDLACIGKTDAGD